MSTTQSRHAAAQPIARQVFLRPSAARPNGVDCCEETGTCDVGHGDCHEDSECLGALVCGTDNCLADFGFGAANWDCCIDANPSDCSQYKGFEGSLHCCSAENPCPVGHGDCDDDSHCAGDLRCGRSNCKNRFATNWAEAQESLDCCYDPAEEGRTCDENDHRPSKCCEDTQNCGVDEGHCENDDECADGLQCGSGNCPWNPLLNCCYDPSS